MYLYVRLNAWDISTKKKDENSSHLRETTQAPAEAAPGRVERDGQAEARRANTTQNGEPHLELGRLRLKTLSKSDLSIAETWPKYLSTNLYFSIAETWPTYL